MSKEKFNKVEGAEETCFCGTKIFCRMKNKGGQFQKLQWQNEDGTPHYDYNFQTKETKCVIPAPKQEQQTLAKPETKQEPITDEYLKKRQEEILSQTKADPHLQAYLEKKFKTLQKIEAFVHDKLGNENAQKIGMYVKILFEGYKEPNGAA